MKKFLMTPLLLLGLMCSQTAWAQDSLIHRYDAYQSPSAEAQRLYKEGQQYTLAGDYLKSITTYKKALALDPNHTDALDNLGLAYRRTGKLKEAEEMYLRSIKLNANNPLPVMNLAVVYNLTGRNGMALMLYKKLQTMEPDDAEGYYGECKMLVATGAEDKAIPVCLKTLAMYEGMRENAFVGDVAYILSIAYYNTGDRDNAKKYFELGRQYKTFPEKELEKRIYGR